MLSPNELQDILSILDRQFSIFTTTHLGPDYLSSQDKKILKDAGLKVDELYSAVKDPVYLNVQLGMLSQLIGENRSKRLKYPDFRRMIERGDHIKLNARERASLESVKMQSLADIRRMKGNIFSDINNIVNQESFIRTEISEGIRRREGVKSIVQNIGRKSGDWSRDFSKMVEYISHRALTEGRVSIMKRKGGGDQKIYFDVYPGACSHCVKHYLTGGIGSRPRVFTISELEANGTNIGRKQKDWKPTFSPLHPFCRCNAHEYEEGSTWDEKEKRWVQPKYERKVDRPTIKVTVGEKIYEV